MDFLAGVNFFFFLNSAYPLCLGTLAGLNMTLVVTVLIIYVYIVASELLPTRLLTTLTLLQGHPFDTVKVRLQTQHLVTNVSIDGKPFVPFSGGFNCMMRTIQHEGISGLFKGMSGPLLTVPAINAVVFAAYEQGVRFIMHKQGKDYPNNSADKPSLGVRCAAGAWSGLVTTTIVAPMELVKTQMQLQYVGKGQKQLRSYQMAIQMVKVGGFRSLGQGAVITGFREVPRVVSFYIYA